jgi:hypothetical protein
MEARRAKRQQQEAERQAGDMARLQRDLAAASLGAAGDAGASSSGREAAAGNSSQGQAGEQGAAVANTGNGHHQQQPQQQQTDEDEEGSADMQLSDESIEYSEGRGMEDD